MVAPPPARDAAAAEASTSTAAGEHRARLRWAVNTTRWTPRDDHDGDEFRFLLDLLPPNERADVVKMVHMADKKRAIASRLLQRMVCHRVTGVPHADVTIKRTKGRKPFLSREAPARGDGATTTNTTTVPTVPTMPDARNFNFNVSHEGDFVVLASEPDVVVGVDVAAPGQARRRGKDGRTPTAEEMLRTFSSVFTEREKDAVRAGGATDDERETVFRQLWSLKEALVKAMGVGLALDLRRAEFTIHHHHHHHHHRISATLTLDGEPKPDWRFIVQPLGASVGGGGGGPPGVGTHWVTVARGPTRDVVDANGEFLKTLARMAFTAEEWVDAVDAPSPPFALLTIGDLVPEALRSAYEDAGGEVF